MTCVDTVNSVTSGSGSLPSATSGTSSLPSNILLVFALLSAETMQSEEASSKLSIEKTTASALLSSLVQMMSEEGTDFGKGMDSLMAYEESTGFAGLSGAEVNALYAAQSMGDTVDSMTAEEVANQQQIDGLNQEIEDQKNNKYWGFLGGVLGFIIADCVSTSNSNDMSAQASELSEANVTLQTKIQGDMEEMSDTFTTQSDRQSSSGQGALDTEIATMKNCWHKLL